MKKIYFFVLLLAVSVNTVIGQVKKSLNLTGVRQVNQVENLKESTVMENVEYANFDFKKATVGTFPKINFQKSSNVNAAASIETEYRRPYGSFVRNALTDNKGVLSKWTIPILVVPAREVIPFNAIWASEANAQFSWSYINGTGQEISLADDTDENGILNSFYETAIPNEYTAFLPKLTATAGTQAATYTYGQETAAGASYYVSPNNLADDEDSPYFTLTDCDAHFGGGPYGGFQSGESFGSDYVVDGSPCVGILSSYAKPLGVLSVRSIDVFAENATETVVIPDGKSLSLSIYYVDENGDMEAEPFATSVATPDDCKLVNWATFINFKFVEIDPDGFETDLILQIQDKPFVVIVDGFDSSYNGLNFLFSTAGGWSGGAYTIHSNGSIKTIGYSDSPSTPMCDLLIAFDGVFNCFEVEESLNNLIIPEEGGNAANADGTIEGSIIYSTFAINELEFDIPDWLTVTYDDSDFGTYCVIYFDIVGTELPDNMDGRRGEIKISSFGRTISLNVIQGNYDGISLAKAAAPQAIREGDNFKLVYPASVSSVSVYNVAGQRVAEYKLNASGTYTMPAADLAKGVYMLKFNGEKAASVKILK
ncbi:MAG: T9SS type A sorting domain-containing protein [Dysgonamonadaceae bacterium]|jgi:hypothetical protein|nr:T9SS type A sorting domain-containing protein [Dysgonamonadaceae bacterium]